MNAKHTPTPYAIVPQNDGSSIIARMHEDASKGFRIVCHVWLRKDSQAEDLANAAFILRAVNAHDDLVKACEAAEQLLAAAQEHDPAWRLDTRVDGVRDMARAALAKARGE